MKHRIIVWRTSLSSATGKRLSPNRYTGTLRPGIIVYNAACCECLSYIGEYKSHAEAAKATCDCNLENSLKSLEPVRNVTREQVGEIRAMWLHGYTVKEIIAALKLRVSVHVVWNIATGRQPASLRLEAVQRRRVSITHRDAVTSRLGRAAA